MRDVINYDRLKQLLQEPIRNISHAYYDAYVEANAVVRAKAGIKTIIVRRQLGKCCDWCRDLVGIYDYNDAPDDIYKRHDNCKCMVTVRSENGTYIDAWTKKEYQTQREVRDAQISVMNTDLVRDNDIQKVKREAMQKGQAYADVTDEWLKYKFPKGSVTDDHEVFYMGDYLPVSKKGQKQNVVLKDDADEKRVAQVLIDLFGGNIHRVPEIKNIDGAATPDYLWNGVRWDLKTIKTSKDKRYAILNDIKYKEKQAHSFIINLISESSPITKDELLFQAEEIFKLEKTKFVDKLIVLYDDKLLKILDRV